MNASLIPAACASNFFIYSACIEESKGFFPDAKRISLAVGDALRAFRTRNNWYMAGNDVLKCPVKPFAAAQQAVETK